MNFDSLQPLKKPFLILLVIGLAVRFILMPFLTFNADVAYWIHAISVDLNNLGMYDVKAYYYTPVWGYLMNISAYVGQFIGITDFGTIVPELAPYVNTEFILNDIVTTYGFNILIKFILVLCDVAVALLIYSLAMRLCGDEKKSLLAAALWFLSPLVITQSAVHAMFDCLSAMTILLSIIFLLDKKYFLAGAAFSLAVFTKFFPLFFFFMLIAILFKKEGFGEKGVKAFTNAFLGAFVAMIVVEFPYIINGQFFRSLDFLIGRLGIGYTTLAPLSPYIDYAVIVGIFVVMCVLIHLLRKHGERLYEKFKETDVKVRDKHVIKGLLIIAGVITAVLLLFSILNYPSTKIDFVDLITYLGMKIVSAIMVYAMLIEFFIAYKILFCQDMTEKIMFAGLMLTSLIIFIWPPSPPYVIVSLPFIIIYATIYNNKLVKPCILMMLMMTVMDLPSYLTSVQTVAYYVPGISMDVVLGPISFLTSTTLGIENIVFAVVILGIIAYLSFINILRVWYLSIREGELLKNYLQ